MTPEGNFVEIGDCASGINHQLRSALWRLMDYKIGEDDKTVYVTPIVVVQIEYTDLFKSKNKIYEYSGKEYRLINTMPIIRLRPDKKVNPQDLRLQQIPQEYLIEEST